LTGTLSPADGTLSPVDGTTSPSTGQVFLWGRKFLAETKIPFISLV